MRRNAKSDGRRISEMRNLGPVCERHLNAVGIRTAADLIRLGEEAAFLQMMSDRKSHDKRKKSINACYLYALYGAIHDIDWRDVPEARKTQFKRFAAELRESGM